MTTDRKTGYSHEDWLKCPDCGSDDVQTKQDHHEHTFFCGECGLEVTYPL